MSDSLYDQFEALLAKSGWEHVGMGLYTLKLNMDDPPAEPDLPRDTIDREWPW